MFGAAQEKSGQGFCILMSTWQSVSQTTGHPLSGQIHFCHDITHVMLDDFLCIGKIISGAECGSTLTLLQRWVLCI